MLVTRHFSLTGETFDQKTSAATEGQNPVFRSPDWWPSAPTKFQRIGFCDWLSIYQRHECAGLPKIAGGAFMRIDRDGAVETVTLKKERIEGSHETAVFIRCDGETVWFDGNVSKFGRPDNVFGYTFSQCLQIINGILSRYGLPPFSEGNKFITNFKGEPRSCWTGAIVTRVDITTNFSTGSKENASAYMRHLQNQQASRLKTGTYGDAETVDFGRGSRRLYIKAYTKGPELRRHIKRIEMDSFQKGPLNPFVVHLADWCDSVGLVRVEFTFKATKLHDMGCHYLGGFDMKLLENEFKERFEVFTRGESAHVDDMTSLPKHLLSTYRMWMAGDDLDSKMSRATFYKHRKALLSFGVDIAIKSNVIQFKPKVRVIKLGPVSIPDWYELPQTEDLKDGTYH